MERKKTKAKNKFDKFFLLSWKKLGLIILSWIVAFLLHGLIYGIFYDYYQATGGDEPVFFILAVIVIPLYFIVMIVYSLVKAIIRGTRKFG